MRRRVQQRSRANWALATPANLRASDSRLVWVLPRRDVPEQLLLLPAHLLYDLGVRQRWLEIVIELGVLLRRLAIQGRDKLRNGCSLPVEIIICAVLLRGHLWKRRS